MASSIKDALDSHLADLAYITNKSKMFRKEIKARKIDKFFAAVQAVEPACTIYIGTYTVGITIPVKSMKHMLEVLEAAEAMTGITFDSSYDNAANGQRVFSTTDGATNWLTIAGVVPLQDVEGQACRRVQTGVQTREYPVYTLECSE
jgi:hypothetical protein